MQKTGRARNADCTTEALIPRQRCTWLNRNLLRNLTPAERTSDGESRNHVAPFETIRRCCRRRDDSRTFGLSVFDHVQVCYFASFGMATLTGIFMLSYMREALDKTGGLANITLDEWR
jgi:hypothetical protein